MPVNVLLNYHTRPPHEEFLQPNCAPKIYMFFLDTHRWKTSALDYRKALLERPHAPSIVADGTPGSLHEILGRLGTSAKGHC